MTYYPLSGYKIDGYDTYGTWKIKVEKVTGLYQLLKRKGDVSQSWLDADGEEGFTNSTDIYFQGADVFMHCILMTSTFDSEFTGFMESFRARLEMAGMRTLTVPYDSRTFSLMYVGGSDIEMMTPLRKSNYYIGRFFVQFRQTTPVRGS